ARGAGHGSDRAEGQRRTAVADAGARDAAAVGVREAGADRMDGEARGEEAGAAAQSEPGAHAVPGDLGPDRAAGVPRAQPVQRVADRDARGAGGLRGGRAHRALPFAGRDRAARAVEPGRIGAVPAAARAGVRGPVARPGGRELPDQPVADRAGQRRAVRPRLREGRAEVRLPARAAQRLHLRHDRRGVGLPGHRVPRVDVRRVRAGGLPGGAAGAGPVRLPARDRRDEPDRRAGVAAHGCGAGARPDHGRDVAVHLVRSFEPAGLPGRGRRAAERRARCGPEGGMSAVLFAGGGTGGHLYPALALAEAMKRERADLVVYFVGARRGVEARVLPKQGVPHVLLPFEPLRRDRVWQNWRLVPSAFRSAAGLARLFRRVKPDLVVGTGGYASGPACAWAVLAGVPMALQEQNAWPGLTTRWLSRWARQVHLGFPEAAARLKPGRRTEVFALGNPIRPPDPTLDRRECRRRFGL